MAKKTAMWAGMVMVVMFAGVSSVWAGGGGQKLKGMEIVIGNFWENYDTDTWKPRNEYEEKVLEHRKKIEKEYGVRIREKFVSDWNNIRGDTMRSIMSGNPIAHVVFLEPGWAMMLQRQGLLAPISDSKAVDFTTTRPAEWNQDTIKAMTIGGKSYGFSFGRGTSHHAAVLYFNKRLFREAGLDPNLPYDMQKNGTWTWANYIDLCKKLTRDLNNDGTIDTYAMTMDLSTEILDAIASSNGASYIAKDGSGKFVNATSRPEFIEALQFATRLKDEGIMMPRPEESNWDWYKSMFLDGKVAIRVEQQYLSGSGDGAELLHMRDDWGMVMFPKGPKSKDYVVYTDENVMIIPSTFPPAEVDKILYAVSLWYAVVDENWKSDFYSRYRDTRAVDETVAYIRNPKQALWKNFKFIPGLERGHIAWEMWWFDGQPAQLVESVSQEWNALINDANKIAQ